MARKATNLRKEQIIEVTRDLIFNEGCSNFTVRTVAARVGISEAAIYKHFAGKEELLLTLLDSMFVPWRSEFQRIATQKTPVSLRINELAATHIDFLMEKRLNPIVFFSEALNPANTKLLQVLQQNLGFFAETIAKLLKEGYDDGEFVSQPAIESTTAALLGTIQTSVIRWTVFQNSDNLKETTCKNVAYILKLISRKEK